MKVPMSDREIPLDKQIAFYDDWAVKYRNVDFGAVEYESRARGEKILSVIESLRLQTPAILEVGCSTGWLTQELTRFGPTVGTDLSPKAIELARQHAPNAEFVSGDFLTIDLSDRHFQVVVCAETLFYVEDQDAFLEKVARLLVPGGYLVLTAVNKFVYERRRDISLHLEDGQVRRWLDRKSLAGLLKKRFTIIRWTTTLPAGNRGILRLLNSPKLNRLLEAFIPSGFIRHAKEAAGLGHTHVILLQKKPNQH